MDDPMLPRSDFHSLYINGENFGTPRIAYGRCLQRLNVHIVLDAKADSLRTIRLPKKMAQLLLIQSRSTSMPRSCCVFALLLVLIIRCLFRS